MVCAQRTPSFASQLNLAARLTREVSASFEAAARADDGAGGAGETGMGLASSGGTDRTTEDGSVPDSSAPPVPEAHRPSATPAPRSRYIGPYLYKGASRESSVASSVATSVGGSQVVSQAASRASSRNASRPATSPRRQGTHPISASAPPPSPRNDASMRSSAHEISSAVSSGSASEGMPSPPVWMGASSPPQGTAEYAAPPTTPLYGRRAAHSAAKPPAR